MKPKRKDPVGRQPDRAAKSPKAASQKTTQDVPQRPAKRPAVSPPTEPEWTQDDRLWFTIKPDCKARVRRAYAGELAAEGFAKNVVFLPADDEALVAVVRREGGDLVRRYCRMRGFPRYARTRGENDFGALFDALRSERILGVDETRDAVQRADELRLLAESEARRRRYQTRK